MGERSLKLGIVKIKNDAKYIEFVAQKVEELLNNDKISS